MPAIPLDGLIGALLIGVIVSSIVYGITCLQVYLYYTEHCARDSTALKTFVAILMALDTLHVALISHTIYYESVTSFGNYVIIQHAPWSLPVQLAVATVIASCVQLFFASRVYKLSKSRNRWVPVSICLCSLGQLIGAFGLCIVDLRRLHSTANVLNPWAVSTTSTNLLCDIIITIAMIYYLNSSRTQFARTNRGINMLITYTLNTGLLTSIFTIINLMMFVMYGRTENVYTPFFFLLARLYLCSFMSTLNSRSAVRAAISEGGVEFVTLSRLHPQTAGTPHSLSGDVLQFKSEPSVREDVDESGL